MVYKHVSRIDEPLSAIGLGCWNFGGDWDTSNQEEAIRVIHAAIDGGVNVIDVAPVYGWGKSETIVGKALQGGKRQKVFLATKCGLLWNDAHETTNNLTAKSIRWEVEESLRRLQTDVIDLYQLHWPDPSTPLEETAQVMAELKKEGKIRYIGLSNFSLSDVKAFDAITPVQSFQGLFNLLERNPSSYHNIPLAYRSQQEIFPYIRQQGMAFLPYSPLFQGLLTGTFQKGFTLSEKDVRSANPKLNGPAFSSYQEAAQKLQDFADSMGKPLNQVIFCWLRQTPVTSIIAGASTVSQMENNLQSLTWELTAEQVRQLEEIAAPYTDLP